MCVNKIRVACVCCHLHVLYLMTSILRADANSTLEFHAKYYFYSHFLCDNTAFIANTSVCSPTTDQSYWISFLQSPLETRVAVVSFMVLVFENLRCRGLTKSSNTTAAREFTPDDTELQWNTKWNNKVTNYTIIKTDKSVLSFQCAYVLAV